MMIVELQRDETIGDCVMTDRLDSGERNSLAAYENQISETRETRETRNLPLR